VLFQFGLCFPSERCNIFRIIIDCGLGEDEDKAAELAKDFLAKLRELAGSYKNDEFGGTKYRLSNDNDRTPKNYLNKNENGHAPTGKAELFG
jgi:hypothetical protein